jgi:hypothetical protein
LSEVTHILDAMTGMGVLPAWVVPSPVEVDDLHWLAYRLSGDTGRPWISGVAETVAWVRGLRTGPITGSDGQPVTEARADIELHAAVTDPHFDAGWAGGVIMALRWLLGSYTGPAVPPLPLPERRQDGTTLIAEDLLAQERAADPSRYETPAQRSAARQGAEIMARQYREIAALIEDTKQRLATV